MFTLHINNYGPVSPSSGVSSRRNTHFSKTSSLVYVNRACETRIRKNKEEGPPLYIHKLPINRPSGRYVIHKKHKQILCFTTLTLLWGLQRPTFKESLKAALPAPLQRATFKQSLKVALLGPPPEVNF